jgi:peptide subunit release factor RF-3
MLADSSVVEMSCSPPSIRAGADVRQPEETQTPRSGWIGMTQARAIEISYCLFSFEFHRAQREDIRTATRR